MKLENIDNLECHSGFLSACPFLRFVIASPPEEGVAIHPLDGFVSRGGGILAMTGRC
jgi:hypothetical protein